MPKDAVWTVTLLLCCIFGHATTTVTTCLPDAVPVQRRRNVVIDGIEQPLGIWALQWQSALMNFEIFKLVVEEVLGYNTTETGRSPVVVSGLWAIAGCREVVSLEREALEKCELHPDFATSNSHVTLETWDFYLPATLEIMRDRHIDRMPVKLGNLGFQGVSANWVPKEAWTAADQAGGFFLDFYRSYNDTSYNPHLYFDSLDTVNTTEFFSKASRCNNFPPMNEDAEARDYMRHFPEDSAGIESYIESDGSVKFRGYCEDGVWWLSPRCREDRSNCIPWISIQGYGYSVMWHKATHYNIAVAMASTDDWVNVIFKNKVLSYAWIPDALFADRGLMHLQFPGYKKYQHDEHLYLTEFAQVAVEKWAHRDLENAAPRIWATGVAMSISSAKMVEHLEHMQREGLSGVEAACHFLQKERSVWEQWIPSSIDCQAGQGLQRNKEGEDVCEWCPRATHSQEAIYHADNQSTTRYCIDCEPGKYQDHTQSSECVACPTGSFAEGAGSLQCSLCEQGSYGPSLGSSSCESCAPGWTTLRRGAESLDECFACMPGSFLQEGMAECEQCPAGRQAGFHGHTICHDCAFLTWSGKGKSECDVDILVIGLCVLWCGLLAAGTALLWFSLTYRCPIADLTFSRNDDPTTAKDETDIHVLQLTTRHWLLDFRHRIPVHFTGTGNKFMDGHRKKFYAQVLSSGSLLIVDKWGEPLKQPLETSLGMLRIKPITALGIVGPFKWMPSSALSAILFAVCTVPIIALNGSVYFSDEAGFLRYSRLHAWHFSVLAIFSIIVAICGIELQLYFFARHGPLQKLHTSWLRKNEIENPDPEACERGANRAVTARQLEDLDRFFRSFLRGRDMYYVCSNLILPLTAPYKLSFAELIGPKVVMWYCSHYWGTPFHDSCACLRKHAESVATKLLRASLSEISGEFSSRSSLSVWQSVSYWVCTVSNNQWRLEEELGKSVQDTSFFVCLRSGHVQGTCIIMDKEARSLTRAWCLFEVLQTVQLRQSMENFTGLWICTPTGVLQHGNASIENAMAIGHTLAKLDVRDAEATVQADKDMIHREVMKFEGGFSAVNVFIKQNLYNALLQMHDTFETKFESVKDQITAEIATASDLAEHVQRRKTAL